MGSSQTAPIGRQLNVRDIDEARALYGNLYTSVSVERRGRRHAFGWKSDIASFGSLTIATSSYASGLVCETDAVEDLYSFALPFTGSGGSAVISGDDVPFVGGKAGFLVSPDMPVKIGFDERFRSVQVSLRRSVVEDAFFSLHHAHVRGTLRFDPRIALGAREGATVRLIRFLRREARLQSPLSSSSLLLARYTEALLHTLLAEQPHNQQMHPGQGPGGGPVHLRRAEEFMVAHAALPITLAELAIVAGVSARALQTAFRQYRGHSPMEFLRQRRLVLARQRLASAATGATVAEVATSCGFDHLGRFSASYRRAFGETPSETLRRR